MKHRLFFAALVLFCGLQTGCTRAWRGDVVVEPQEVRLPEEKLSEKLSEKKQVSVKVAKSRGKMLLKSGAKSVELERSKVVK